MTWDSSSSTLGMFCVVPHICWKRHSHTCMEILNLLWHLFVAFPTPLHPRFCLRLLLLSFFISAPGSKSNISQPTIKHIPNHHVVPSKPDIERSKVFIPSSFNCADKKSLRRWRHKKTREKDLCWGSVWCCMFIKQPEKPPSPLERNYENFNKWTLEYCRKFCFHQTKENCEQKKTLSVGEKSWERRAKKKLQNNIYKARSMSRDVMWTICVMRFLSSVDG